MDTRVLKEPRGFMRILQWFFAIIAFSTCVHFNTTSNYSVFCTSGSVVNVSHPFEYPFRLDHTTAVNVTCVGAANTTITRKVYPPGDYKTDAEFFVFTGVFAFLLTMALLFVYVFFSGLYANEPKFFPTVDFWVTLLVAIFWLAASASWANAVINMKYTADPTHWIFRNTDKENSICSKQADDKYVYTAVRNCESTFGGKFTEANVSVIIGFLNFFLWSTNLWFLYKETTWFAARSGQPQGQQLSS